MKGGLAQHALSPDSGGAVPLCQLPLRPLPVCPQILGTHHLLSQVPAAWTYLFLSPHCLGSSHSSFLSPLITGPPHPPAHGNAVFRG